MLSLQLVANVLFQRIANKIKNFKIKQSPLMPKKLFRTQASFSYPVQLRSKKNSCWQKNILMTAFLLLHIKPSITENILAPSVSTRCYKYI